MDGKVDLGRTDSVFALVGGGKGVGADGRVGGGGVVKIWKFSVQKQQQQQQQRQQQQQQQQQQQRVSKQSLRQFVKDASRFKKKEQADLQICLESDPLACFLLQDIPSDLRLVSSSADAQSGSVWPSSNYLRPSTHGLLLHIGTCHSFCCINLFPLPSLQQVHRTHSLAALPLDAPEGSLSKSGTSKENSNVHISSYFDAVQAPLLHVSPADGCAVTVDESGNVVSRDLATGRVVAVMQKRERADARVVCVCHVPKSVRDELSGGSSEDFPAFFVAHERGAVGVYTGALRLLSILNPIPALSPSASADIDITCVACWLSDSNSVLVLGLADGRIMLYDLDGGDAAESCTSAASVARSLPIAVEDASSDAVCGISCSGATIAVAWSRSVMKLLDVRKGRNVIASMTVSNDKNIVAALYQQRDRAGVVMLLQVHCCTTRRCNCNVAHRNLTTPPCSRFPHPQCDGTLSCLEWKGSGRLKPRCQKTLDIGMTRGSCFSATAMDVYWGVNGLGCVAAVACSAATDSGASAHVLLVDGATLSILR
jgi:WD40 repeat protein